MQAMNQLDRSDLIRFFPGFAAFKETGVEPRGQVLQDAFAVAWAGPDPIFVDCGAGRLKSLSNTWALQRHLGWSGRLIEPNPSFASDLRTRITSNVRLAEVAAGTEGVVEFLTLDELSCATDYMRSDCARSIRDTAVEQRKTILVNRVPLIHLLDQHMGKARKLDFLSLDAEGAEIEVLRSLDLSRWSFRCMAIEHADVPGICESFDQILLPHGYRRVLEYVSAFEAFYVLDDK